ncbi:hypothetical protein [Facklamia sp. 7083-14-GEN3]|uniref:hypothetical protein n=1 Tax=Facklamia sp. 7083-14-GEN3 TaxID=2973478 RepID=UPI00215CBC10|nr:hypothetical protein [Facklamia sp. 7083-14-GEN3]MCR8968535.1 hypothetical protein [Facklamia sp. 7083-14-GEN3]
MDPVLLKENHIYPLLGPNQKQKVENGKKAFVLIGLKSDYLDLFPEESVEEDQWIIASHLIDVSKIEEIYWGDNEKHAVHLGNRKIIPSMLITDSFYIGVNSLKEMEALRSYLSIDETKELKASSSLYFNLINKESESLVQELAQQKGMTFVSKSSSKRDLYQLNGGLLFIGLIVSCVLIIGMILMLYFKQISEGYEDKKNYQIMKQVGLPIQLIKKTIRSQVLWVFFLPLIVAVIHNLYASRIVFKLLGILGVNDFKDYLLNFTWVVIGFILFYLIFYQLTSQAYYRIINQED